MGVFFVLHLGVVLSMHGNPLPGYLSGGEPQPRAEEMRDDRVQNHGPMGHRAVKIKGHGHDGNVGRYQGNRDVSPDG